MSITAIDYEVVGRSWRKSEVASLSVSASFSLRAEIHSHVLLNDGDTF